MLCFICTLKSQSQASLTCLNFAVTRLVYNYVADLCCEERQKEVRQFVREVDDHCLDNCPVRHASLF